MNRQSRLCPTTVCAAPARRRARKSRCLRGPRWLTLAACSDPGCTTVKVMLPTPCTGSGGQRIMALVAHARRVDGSIRANGQRSDFAPGSFEQYVALALRIDAVHEAAAVGTGDQVALRVPRQRADMLLVALEELFRLGAGLCGIDPVHRTGAARGDIESPGGIECQVPDVVGPCLSAGSFGTVQRGRRQRPPLAFVSSCFVVASALSL